MKIKFCCEEIKSIFDIVEYISSGRCLFPVFDSNDDIVDYEERNTCPYCGAKIEITVKEQT